MNTVNNVGEYISNMIRDDENLERYLLASPYCNDFAYDYSKQFSEDLFNNVFYEFPSGELSEDEGSLVQKISQNCLHDSKNTIFMVGNKGCGKSTFAHRVNNKLKREGNRTQFIDFGLPNSTLSYTKSKETVGRNMYSQLRDFISKNNFQPIYRLIKIYEDTEYDIDVHFDANNKIGAFFSKLKFIIESESPMFELKKDIRYFIFSMELFQMFLIMILLDYCLQISEGEIKKTTVFLDNLDNFSSIKHISDFLQNYINFRSCFDKLVGHIKEHDSEFCCVKYTFVLIMRETTKLHISPHLLEVLRLSSLTYDLTNIYDKRKIVYSRLKYIEENKRLFSSKFVQEAEHIKNILSDKYIVNTMFPLFNNDYRSSVKSIVKICTQSNYIKEFNRLISRGDDSYKFGGRGIVYRLIFNLFKNKGYFDQIFLTSLSSRGNENSSLPRVILTYLENVTKPDLCDDTYAAPLKDILNRLGHISPDKIVKCIWGMFSLSTSENWNHLLTFAHSDCINETALQNESSYILSNDYSNNMMFSTLRITPAGIAFTTNVCTHFEFFACRIFGEDTPPLFSKRSFKVENNEPIFYEILGSVYKQVKKCCELLSSSLEGAYGICCDANSNFNYKNIDNNRRQFHTERLIFTHIGYIEAFRGFLISEGLGFGQEELYDHLKYVSKIERQYLNLFEDRLAKCSPQNKSVLERINEQVGTIETNPFAPYMNF